MLKKSRQIRYETRAKGLVTFFFINESGKELEILSSSGIENPEAIRAVCTGIVFSVLTEYEKGVVAKALDRILEIK